MARPAVLGMVIRQALPLTLIGVAAGLARSVSIR
jgi:hypothetical protein